MKESTAADLMRIFFAIIAAVLIIPATVLLALKFSIMNPTFWINIVEASGFTEYVVENIDVDSYDIDFIEDKEGFTSDIIAYMTDEMLETIKTGDPEIDRDTYDDIFDDYIDDALQNAGATEDMVDEKREELFEQIQGEMDEFGESLEKAGYFRAVKRSNDRLTTPAYVMSGIVLAMFIILVPMHKNKFRVLRAGGIALTVSEGLMSIIVGGIVMLAVRAVDSVNASFNGDPGLAKLLSNAIVKGMTNIMLVIVGLFVLGIIMIVVGATMTKKLNATNEAADQGDPWDGYTPYNPDAGNYYSSTYQS